MRSSAVWHGAGRHSSSALRALSGPQPRARWPTPDLEERADLLLGMVLGSNIAVRGGASGSEVDRMLRAVTRRQAGWRARP